ncbi:MAG: nitroreductase family protein [Bacillota bacterium]
MSDKVLSDWTETEKVILSRRSVRLYKDDQVPGELVRRILECGRFAPSAGNSQPWKFVVVREQEILDEMESSVVSICKNMKELLSLVKSPEPINPVPYAAIGLIANGKLRLFHGAKTVIMVLKDVRGVGKPDYDCGLASQNIVLAAHSLGLGTCYIGFLDPLFQLPEWRERFDIDFPYEFECGIALGYPKGKPDGMVERDTLAIDWYESGTKTVVY